MSGRQRVASLVARLTGTTLLAEVPRGVSVYRDIARHLPLFGADVIFDVGANIGQSATVFLEAFPESQIYCFEPSKQSFDTLEGRLRHERRAQGFRLALGASRTTRQLMLKGSPDMFQLADETELSGSTETGTVEVVAMDTVDLVCREHDIARINYLKVDTEGGDLEVLRGAEEMLRSQRIDLVEVEAGMNRKNRRHVPMEALKEHLERRDYFVFGIYEQVHEWPTREAHLRRINAVFVSERLIHANTPSEHP